MERIVELIGPVGGNLHARRCVEERIHPIKTTLREVFCDDHEVDIAPEV